MISILICSVNEERLARVSENVAATIGAGGDYEILARDNRGTGIGICQVYNELAAEAHGDLLCFMHEDVGFDTPDWGSILAQQALLPQTGIVGFAGAAIKTRTTSGVHHKRYEECSVATLPEGTPIPAKYDTTSVTGTPDFAPVVTLDGVFLLMRREVFDKVGGFDQTNFQGFHLYDLDISTAAFAANYTNYVCHCVRMAHYSRGDYSQTWWENSVKYSEKWSDKLPMYVNRPSDKQVEKDEQYIHFNITYHLLKRSRLDPETAIWPRIIWEWRKKPFYHKTLYHIYRYTRYKAQYKKQTTK